jgi:hypothetical protein
VRITALKPWKLPEFNRVLPVWEVRDVDAEFWPTYAGVDSYSEWDDFLKLPKADTIDNGGGK